MKTGLAFHHVEIIDVMQGSWRNKESKRILLSLK